SNLVMYDRQTESLWPQLTGQAAVGVMTGVQLEFVPVFPVGWAAFREAHPDGWVLSRDTGYSRDYGRNPYLGYDTDPGRDPLFGAPTDDERLLPLERVIALEGGGETVAVLRSLVEQARVLTETVGGQPLVLLFTSMMPRHACCLCSGQSPQSHGQPSRTLVWDVSGMVPGLLNRALSMYICASP
ncbi:MAG TPA: DUF3179 domain-containing (seleno)protein, partial [Jiangellaceae bacterium]